MFTHLKSNIPSLGGAEMHNFHCGENILSHFTGISHSQSPSYVVFFVYSTQSIPKGDWSKHYCPATCVIFHHYSSPTFVLFHLHSHKEKSGMCFKNVIISICFYCFKIAYVRECLYLAGKI
jgi:hypothetical protein